MMVIGDHHREYLVYEVRGHFCSKK